MISYLLHRLFADTCTVDMNGAAITITYYNEAPLTKVKPKNKKTCEHHSGEKEIIFHGHLLGLYFLIITCLIGNLLTFSTLIFTFLWTGFLPLPDKLNASAVPSN